MRHSVVHHYAPLDMPKVVSAVIVKAIEERSKCRA